MDCSRKEYGLPYASSVESSSADGGTFRMASSGCNCPTGHSRTCVRTEYLGQIPCGNSVPTPFCTRGHRLRLIPLVMVNRLRRQIPVKLCPCPGGVKPRGERAGSGRPIHKSAAFLPPRTETWASGKRTNLAVRYVLQQTARRPVTKAKCSMRFICQSIAAAEKEPYGQSVSGLGIITRQQIDRAGYNLHTC